MSWRTFFPARIFVGQTSLFMLCLGSELVTKLAFSKLDCMPKSFWSVVLMFGTVQNSPWSLEMLLAKTESSCTTCIGKCYVCACCRLIHTLRRRKVTTCYVCPWGQARAGDHCHHSLQLLRLGKIPIEPRGVVPMERLCSRFIN